MNGFTCTVPLYMHVDIQLVEGVINRLFIQLCILSCPILIEYQYETLHSFLEYEHVDITCITHSTYVLTASI